MHPLLATHATYTTLLHRVGRCLSFGCTHRQTLAAAALAARLTRAWPASFLGAEGYVGSSRLGVRAADGEAGLVAAAEASSRLLLGGLLGEGRFTAVRDDVRVYPVTDAKLPPSTPLTTLSRFGDSAPQALSTLSTLSRIPPAWSPGSKSLLLIQSAVLSGSMRPVATVREVLRVESAGADVHGWAGEHAEVLGAFLRELEERVGGEGEVVRGLEGKVRELECGTWDREGAVEDTGGRK